MNVACPECRSVFRVDPAKVPDVAVRARCSVCGGVITVMPEQATAASAPRPMPRATFTPARSATPVSPATPPAATPAGPVRRTAIPFMGPRSGAPASPRPATPPRAPSAPVFRPSVVPPIAAPVAAPTPPAPATPTSPTTPATPATPAAPARRTPINPFLSNDPNVKAKRLARALVSDLIVYFPQKRDEGLRDGNLKEIFREEIKKSYEEFVDQVGKEFADSTSHFTDALNEILAAGQPVFSGPYTG